MTPTIFAALFFIAYALHHGFETVLDLLQLRHLRRKRGAIPKYLAGKVTSEDMRKAVAYSRDKLRFSLVGRLFDAAFLLVLVGFGFGFVDRQIASLHFGPFVSSLALLGAVSLVQGLAELPLSLFRTFVLEERHDMNRQTLAGFVSDLGKQLALGLVLGGALVSALLGAMMLWDAWFVVPAIVALIGFQVFVGWIFPVVLLPWFNKLSPVTEELEAKISTLAAQVGFPVAAVLAMDGSRRSVAANAFVAGFGKTRRIVLFDTLLEKISPDEVLAVIAHELGHYKLRHIERRLVLGFVAAATAIAAMALLRAHASLVAGLGFTAASDGAVLIAFSLVAPELVFPLTWIGRVLSRRDEYAADRFAVHLVGEGKNLSNALVALSKQNRASPTSHPLYRNYHASHPGLRRRLVAIEKA